MPFKVIITRDFEHMSAVGADIVTGSIRQVLDRQDRFILGLATGNTPTGLYKHLAKAANGGAFTSARITSFNLDEYIGLPGENPQQRTLHPESYSFFMIRELFGRLRENFRAAYVPWGALIDQGRLEAELAAYPDDWEKQGADKGKAVVIRPEAASDYLRWIRREILDAYEREIAAAGGIDLHIVGVGGRGHVAFHEAGIPFPGNRMLLVQLDDNTIDNAVADRHFSRREESPRFAVSMGAELVYEAKAVLLLANGKRKAEPVAASLLEDVNEQVPISYGQVLAGRGGEMTYVLDREAAAEVLTQRDRIESRGIEIEELAG